MNVAEVFKAIGVLLLHTAEAAAADPAVQAAIAKTVATAIEAAVTAKR